MKWGWTEENTHRVVKLALLVLQMQVIRPTLPKQGQRQPFAARCKDATLSARERDHPSITNSFLLSARTSQLCDISVSEFLGRGLLCCISFPQSNGLPD